MQKTGSAGSLACAYDIMGWGGVGGVTGRGGGVEGRGGERIKWKKLSDVIREYEQVVRDVMYDGISDTLRRTGGARCHVRWYK